MTGANPGGRDFNGSIPMHMDSDSGEDGEDKPFRGEDELQPYHVQMKQQGITFNEWKDKKYDWDLRVQHLNKQVFGNDGFRES